MDNFFKNYKSIKRKEIILVIAQLLIIFLHFLNNYSDSKKRIANNNFTKIVLIAPVLIAAVLFLFVSIKN